jgi:hypothetical protein
MKTFTGWREAGRAMMWARHEGNFRDRTSMQGSWRHDRPPSIHVEHRWREPGGREVMISHSSLVASVDVSVSDGLNSWDSTYNDDAGQVLRVLAALGLIPAKLAVRS